MTDNRFQVDSLDGLRGVAALIVVLSHTSLAKMYFLPSLNFSGIGKSGVYLFFLLSSFLLMLPLLDKGKDLLSFPILSHYFQRRIFRIYPLYSLYLVLAVFTTWAASRAVEPEVMVLPFSLDWEGFLRHLSLLEGKGVTWSIAVEFKFYFVLPLFAYAAIHVSKVGIGASSIFFLLLLVLSQLISPQSEAGVNDSSLLPYMPIFILGMYLAVVQHEINQRDGELSLLFTIFKNLGYIGLLGNIILIPAVYSLVIENVSNGEFHQQFILYGVLWSFVLMSVVNSKSVLQKVLTFAPLRLCGVLSFSLYLFHGIIIEISQYFGIEGYFGAWTVLVVSLVLSFITFKLLEEPVSKFKVGSFANLSLGKSSV